MTAPRIFLYAGVRVYHGVVRGAEAALCGFDDCGELGRLSQIHGNRRMRWPSRHREPLCRRCLAALRKKQRDDERYAGIEGRR
jgi:hypothetical protein